MERHFKGIANHWRIDILFLVDKASGISLEQMAEHLHCNFKTLSEHTSRLVKAGLLNKRYHGRQVAHTLSPYGTKILKLIRTF